MKILKKLLTSKDEKTIDNTINEETNYIESYSSEAVELGTRLAMRHITVNPTALTQNR